MKIRTFQIVGIVLVEFILLLFVLKTTQFSWPTIHIEFEPTKIFRLALLFIMLVISLIPVFMISLNTAEKKWIKNGVLLGSSIIITLIILEGVFMYVPKSHRLGEVTLAHKMWTKRYWKPINKAGFRDDEYNVRENIDKDIVYVIGDSFVAGHGIKNYKDRFTNQLEKALSGQAKVLNLGVNGFSSKHEAYLLQKYLQERRTKKPSLVVLSYYGNDIMPNNETLYTTYKGLKRWQAFIVKNSYFANYLYWMYEHNETYDYVEFLKKAYGDNEKLYDHFKYLKTIQYLCQKNSIPLIVVMFPFLADLEQSKVYTEKVSKFFNVIDVQVIDVSQIVKDLPVKKRIVNVNDHHPSPTVHKMVAEELYKFISK